MQFINIGQIILKGNISNDNDYLQFMTDVVKFSAGIATGGISNFVLGAAVSEVINAIPETEDYNVIHGQNVLCANSIVFKLLDLLNEHENSVLIKSNI